MRTLTWDAIKEIKDWTPDRRLKEACNSALFGNGEPLNIRKAITLLIEIERSKSSYEELQGAIEDFSVMTGYSTRELIERMNIKID